MDLNQQHMALFWSQGLHSHIPPPPSKPPTQILQAIFDMIRRARSPDMTLSEYNYLFLTFLLFINYLIGVFLRSSALREFCKQYSHRSLSSIHPSLGNMDRLAAVILKQRALAYPEGRDLAGVYFELSRDPELKVVHN
jgi:hypothetical protein